MKRQESNFFSRLKDKYKTEPLEIPRRLENEHHFVIEGSDWNSKNNVLIEICKLFLYNKLYLCTCVAVDERLHDALVFKIFYVFASRKVSECVILEYALDDPQHPREFSSIRDIYPSAGALEKEMSDMYGLYPIGEGSDVYSGEVFRTGLPLDLFPLRRTRTDTELMERIAKKEKKEWDRKAVPPHLPEGMFVVPVGPIHAGIIEAGYFPFRVAGEMIEELPVCLGYKHRGIEKLFETDFDLESGWALAEKVSGDSSYSHSLAYCLAVENLAGVTVTQTANYWRCLFLELERMVNHITDVGSMVHDMALDRIATPLSYLRESLVQLCGRVTGHRFLRGINRPGGIILPQWDLNQTIADISYIISSVNERFIKRSKKVLDMPSCRDRMISIGVLTRKEARNGTGLVRRASGDTIHDFRLFQPWGVYRDPKIKKIVETTIETHNVGDIGFPGKKRMPVFSHELKGDVYARMAIRIAEVEASVKIIKTIMEWLKRSDSPENPRIVPVKDALKKVPVRDIGIGCVEGWRGDIFYFIMKGPDNSIFRCQPRDPSIFNWQILPKAVERKEKESGGNTADPKAPKEYWENLLADFPLINKSFNLSYAGNDR